MRSLMLLRSSRRRALRADSMSRRLSRRLVFVDGYADEGVVVIDADFGDVSGIFETAIANVSRLEGLVPRLPSQAGRLDECGASPLRWRLHAADREDFPGPAALEGREELVSR